MLKTISCELNRHVPFALFGTATGIVILLVFAGCGVPGPGGPADTFGLDFSMPPGMQTRGAIVFFVAGVNAKLFEEMLTAGELPACKIYFVDRGLYVPRAVANTPSVTMVNQTSFITGLLPGHHGITGINWFDRNRLIWRNYETIAQKNTLDGDYTAKTIYELFDDETTFSIFFQAHRGATKFVENRTSAGPVFFFGWYEFVDRLSLLRFNIFIDVARKRRRFPAVTICYLLAADFRGYACGVSSEQYRQALRHTDRQIGRVLGDLQRAGILKDLIIAIVSDHGLRDVEKHFQIEKFLRNDLGLDIAPRRLWEQTPFEQRLDYYRRFSAVLYGSGDRYEAICLRKPLKKTDEAAGFEPWPIRPGPEDLKAYPTSRGVVDLPGVLTKQEAVDAVAYTAGPDRVRVRRRGGEVEFRQPGGQGAEISHHLIWGADPFGWTGKIPPAMLSGKPASARKWLQATAGTDYPDLPAQILAYFRARRAGDIAVFAAPGWDFNNVNRAGHGGLLPEDMCVPLLIAGAGVQHGRLEVARTIDLMPTLLRLLGRKIPEGLDGQDLLKAKVREPLR